MDDLGGFTPIFGNTQIFADFLKRTGRSMERQCQPGHDDAEFLKMTLQTSSRCSSKDSMLNIRTFEVSRNKAMKFILHKKERANAFTHRAILESEINVVES